MRIGEFITKNRNKLIIICDPSNDKCLMAYRDKIVINQIKRSDGKNSYVVKRVLKHSTFQGAIDEFLVALIESFWVKVVDARVWLQWIDGALYNISKLFGKPPKDKNKQKKRFFDLSDSGVKPSEEVEDFTNKINN